MIEDLPPLYDVPLTVRVPQVVTSVYLAPGGAALPMRNADGAVTVTIPKVQSHQAVVFEYQAQTR